MDESWDHDRVTMTFDRAQPQTSEGVILAFAVIGFSLVAGVLGGTSIWASGAIPLSILCGIAALGGVIGPIVWVVELGSRCRTTPSSCACVGMPTRSWCRSQSVRSTGTRRFGVDGACADRGRSGPLLFDSLVSVADSWGASPPGKP